MRIVPAGLVVLLLLMLCSMASSQPSPAPDPVHSQGVAGQVGAGNVVIPAQTLERLEARVSAAEAELKDVSSKSVPGYWAAGGVVIAALLAGAAAIWNHRVAAKEGQLLRAIELIMGSRNAHEARLRMLNLAPFLTPAIQAHWESMLPKVSDEPGRALRQDLFSGSEWTELRIKVAESMVADPERADEILRIWQAVMKEKGAVTGVDWSPAPPPAAPVARRRPLRPARPTNR